MIALALAAATALLEERWRPIDEAAFMLRECEVYVGAEQSLLAVTPLTPGDRSAAQEQSCRSERRKLDEARRDFYLANRRLVRRLISYFDPNNPACWDALGVIDNNHSGLPERERNNPQLQVCREAVPHRNVR